MPRDTLDAPVRTETDLFQLWRALMGPGGFGRRSLWMLFLQPDAYPCKVIVPIDDIADEPDARFVANIKLIIDGIGKDADVGSVPVLLSRSGPTGMTARDRRWAAALRTDAPAELTRWPIHLATTDRIQVFAPDDLIAAS